jgi:hypothetical protein
VQRVIERHVRDPLNSNPLMSAIPKRDRVILDGDICGYTQGAEVDEVDLA